MRLVMLLGLAAVVVQGGASAEEGRIAFPAEYRSAFTNYLSLDRVQEEGQVIRLFANAAAMGGMDENGKFSNGSVLVGEVYTAKRDEAGLVIESELGRRIRDKLVLIAVMEKQAGWGAGFAEEHKNGDWDFAAFKPDGSVAGKDLNACRACHAPLLDADHVFSYEHLDD